MGPVTDGVTSAGRGFFRGWHRFRWYPHMPIALLSLPLGLILVIGGLRGLLGLEPFTHFFRELAPRLQSAPHAELIDFALGLCVLALSAGLAMRSGFAWLCAVAAVSGGLLLRLVTPLRSAEIALGAYELMLLTLLVLHRQTFSRRSRVTTTASAAVILVIFLIYAVIGTLRLGSEFHPVVTDLQTAAYFVMVTFATVGYGDITPQTPEARWFVLMMIFLGILVGGTALSAVLIPVLEGRVKGILTGREAFVDRSGHYVVVGGSPLARNTVQELERRKQRVTLVLDTASQEEFFRSRDVVLGDPTDLGVLRSAGVADARAVLALSTDDAKNGFVVLGVHELAPNVTTVVAANDPASESRLRRTQPSLLLSLQVLGGELLAMALTGEQVDQKMLLSVLQLNPGAAAAPGEDPKK